VLLQRFFATALFTLVSIGAHGQNGSSASALNFKDICYVDGVKYSGVAGVNNCNRLFSASSPGVTWIPSNMPSTALWSAPSDGSIIVDTRFTNSPGLLEGTLPAQKPHWLFDFHAGQNQTYELGSSSGPMGLSVEGFADAGGSAHLAQGTVVSLFSGAQRNGGVRGIWAINTQTVLTPGHFANGAAHSAEFDMSNNSGTDATVASAVDAVTIMSGGTNRSGIGLAITAPAPHNYWMLDQLLANYVSIGLQISNGLKGSVAQQIVPPDDSTAFEIRGVNHATTHLSWGVQNDGGSIFNYVQAVGAIGGTGQSAAGLIRLTNAASSVCMRNKAGNADHCFGEIQHVRTAGCTTGGSSAFTGPCSTTVTWPSAFADADYTPECTGEGVGGGVPILQGISGRSASSMVVQIQQATGARANFAVIDCVGVHD
jgi:hypothetical protein